MLQVTELEPYKCYKIAVTAVNEKGHSISQYYNISCDPKTGSLTGKYIINLLYIRKHVIIIVGLYFDNILWILLLLQKLFLKMIHSS